MSKGTWKWQFDCWKCGHINIAQERDVTSTPNTDEDGKVQGHICVVKCEDCDAANDVPLEKVNKKIKKIAALKRERVR